jgi:hypothetical protein
MSLRGGRQPDKAATVFEEIAHLHCNTLALAGGARECRRYAARNDMINNK